MALCSKNRLQGLIQRGKDVDVSSRLLVIRYHFPLRLSKLLNTNLGPDYMVNFSPG